MYRFNPKLCLLHTSRHSPYTSATLEVIALQASTPTALLLFDNDCLPSHPPTHPPPHTPISLRSTHLGIRKQCPDLVLAARLLTAQVLSGLGAQLV